MQFLQRLNHISQHIVALFCKNTQVAEYSNLYSDETKVHHIFKHKDMLNVMDFCFIAVQRNTCLYNL